MQQCLLLLHHYSNYIEFYFLYYLSPLLSNLIDSMIKIVTLRISRFHIKFIFLVEVIAKVKRLRHFIWCVITKVNKGLNDRGVVATLQFKNILGVELKTMLTVAWHVSLLFLFYKLLGTSDTSCIIWHNTKKSVFFMCRGKWWILLLSGKQRKNKYENVASFLYVKKLGKWYDKNP
jgi:hypothetical protein